MKNHTMGLAAAALLLVLGCGDDDDDKSTDSADSELEGQFTAKLRECGILGQGTYNDDQIEDDFDRCAARCVIDSQCSALEVVCSDDEPPENAYVRCQRGCFTSTEDSQFRCADGSRIPHSFRCDLYPDCEDGEDEGGGSNCGEYLCANGEKVPSDKSKCDGIVDCRDGSDEDGCASFCE